MPLQLNLPLKDPAVPESASGWYTVQQFCERNPAFTESSMRSYIFNAEKHGLQSAIARAGRKVLINEELWFAALQQEKK